MGHVIIVFNIGSSTLKAGVFDADNTARPRLSLEVELPSGRCHASAGLPDALQSFPPNQLPEHIAEVILDVLEQEGLEIDACVHRVVHGGPLRRQAQLVDEHLLDDLERYEPLCPLHQPAALEAIRYLRALLPCLTQIAVYDTAFHLGQSPLATEYALPLMLRLDGVRAYGFHGISCQHLLRQLRAEHPELAHTRLLLAHLGSGASVTAVDHGHSVATTMGFSTLEGLPMGTRSGHVDPGILLYLLEKGWAKSRLTDLLYHQSGLLGLSGVSADMRVLINHDSEAARFAVDYFCYRIAREAASLAAAMEGVDAMVFTGGIGEHQPAVRANIVSRMGWLGARLDSEANSRSQGRIDSECSHIKLLVIPAGEEQEMARQALDLLRDSCTAEPLLHL